MEIILLLFLIFSVGMGYLVDKKDIISPITIFPLAILSSYFIILINFENWTVEINTTFTICIIIAVISFFVGAIVIKSFYNRVHHFAENEVYSELSIRHQEGNYPYKLLAMISCILLLVYFVLKMGELRSMSWSDFSNSLSSVYNANARTHGGSSSFFVTQILEIEHAIAYISVYKFMVDNYCLKKKTGWSIVIPMICFVLTSLISTDRNIFLRFAIYFICLWIMFFRTQFDRKNVNTKLLSRIVIMLLVILIIFYFFGLAKKYTSNFTRVLSIYGGSGLYDFNLWLERYNGKFYHGRATFSVLFSTINQLLGTHISLDFPGDSYINYKSANGYIYSSNIYSSLQPYYLDFGYWGMFIMPFINGMIFELLYMRGKRYEKGFKWILFAMLIYGIIYTPVQEQFLRRLHLGMVYEIGWVFILYLLIYGKKGLWNVKFTINH